MSLFAEYVTSCAFHLNLSRQAAQCLWLIDRHQRGGEAPYGHASGFKMTFGSHSDNFVPAVKSLERRGLVDHHEAKLNKKGHRIKAPGFFAHTLTQPGKLVLDLCVLASVVPARWSKVVELPKKKRRAA